MYFARTFISHLKSLNILQRNVNKVTKKFKFNLCQHFSNSSGVCSEEIIDTLCKGDAALDEKLRKIMLEIDLLRQDNGCVPDNLRINDWEELMYLQSRTQRKNYLLYRWKTEKAKENAKAKKDATKLEMANRKSPEETKEYPDDLSYGLGYMSRFIRIYPGSIDCFDNYRLMQSTIHGRPIVFDCSYDEFMVRREIKNAAKQCLLSFAYNRKSKDPFSMHFCNVNLDGYFMQTLRNNIPEIEKKWFPINIHSTSYLDLFPKENLVYLTPHCREELTKFDDDDVYIIGCMVDKRNHNPLSLAKAKREGLRMAKLPLTRYLKFTNTGNATALNINHVMSILLDLSLTRDWEYALRHVPKRKHRPNYENANKSEKYKNNKNSKINIDKFS